MVAAGRDAFSDSQSSIRGTIGERDLITSRPDITSFSFDAIVRWVHFMQPHKRK